MSSAQKFEGRPCYEDHPEWISDHLADFFSEEEITVFHEIVSLDMHLDVYFIKPAKHSFNILLTSGMSLFSMEVDKNADSQELQFAELMMLLPKDLAFENVFTGKEKNSWIISMVKQIARFPHYYDTWIGIGHTIQATEDLQSYSKETDYVGAVILPSVTFENDFTEIRRKGRKINIYSVFPLYKNELEFKVNNGFNNFAGLLRSSNAEEIFNHKRKNLISGSGLWSIFRGGN